MSVLTGKRLAGLAVLALDDGARVGRVEDVVFHVASGRITGFLVDPGGVFARTRFLPAGQVKSVGADALTITGADALSETDPTKDDPEEWQVRPLEGRPVLNASGTALGKVADVLVDTETLTVPALTLSTGMIDNALHGKPRLPLSFVKTVGRDSLIVPDTYNPASPEYHDAAHL